MSEPNLMVVMDDGNGATDTIDPIVRIVVDNGYNEYELPLRHGASIRVVEVV